MFSFALAPVNASDMFQSQRIEMLTPASSLKRVSDVTRGGNKQLFAIARKVHTHRLCSPTQNDHLKKAWPSKKKHCHLTLRDWEVFFFLWLNRSKKMLNITSYKKKISTSEQTKFTGILIDCLCNRHDTTKVLFSLKKMPNCAICLKQVP